MKILNLKTLFFRCDKHLVFSKGTGTNASKIDVKCKTSR